MYKHILREKVQDEDHNWRQIHGPPMDAYRQELHKKELKRKTQEQNIHQLIFHLLTPNLKIGVYCNMLSKIDSGKEFIVKSPHWRNKYESRQKIESNKP